MTASDDLERIRGLAGRWARCRRARALAPNVDLHAVACGERILGHPPTFTPLPADEHATLLGWVLRRMEREVERRTELRDQAALAEAYSAAPDSDDPYDGAAVNDREAIAHAVAQDLGGEFLRGRYLAAEHGLAWTLCELATEGRWCEGRWCDGQA